MCVYGINKSRIGVYFRLGRTLIPICVETNKTHRLQFKMSSKKMICKRTLRCPGVHLSLAQNHIPPPPPCLQYNYSQFTKLGRKYQHD
jgi:hypothetical protein